MPSNSTNLFKRKEKIMGIKVLAEAIILQSIEDLWDEKQKEDSIRFFDEEGFSICAEIAGMGLFEQLRLYNMVNRITKSEGKKVKKSLTLTAA